jgi:hypothetical protein
MPWVPELFCAPVIAQFDAKQRRRVEIVPNFGRLGEVEALVGSFVGEPRIHHPCVAD